MWEYRSVANVKKMPVIKGVYVEKGVFFCGKCRFETDLDSASGKPTVRLENFIPGGERNS